MRVHFHDNYGCTLRASALQKSLHGLNTPYITAQPLPGIMSPQGYFKPLQNNTDTQRLCVRVKQHLVRVRGRLISLSFTPSGPIPCKSRCKHRKVSSKLTQHGDVTTGVKPLKMAQLTSSRLLDRTPAGQSAQNQERGHLVRRCMWYSALAC